MSEINGNWFFLRVQKINVDFDVVAIVSHFLCKMLSVFFTVTDCDKLLIDSHIS